MEAADFEIDVKIILRKKGTPRHAPALGRGVVELCRLVERKGSLNQAARAMGMAYSKAWRIMKQTEEAFGFPLLNRDGAHGSTLTPEGSELLRIYDAAQERLDTAACATLNDVMS